MAFFKFTTFFGRNDTGEAITGSRDGHWRPETIERAARKAGIVGKINVAHNVGDTSGRGRGGRDGRFTIGVDAKVTKVAA